MGGNLPLGYDTADRKLIVNKAEAEIVRHIFARYLALKSVRLLKSELDRNGIVSKVRVSKAGNVSGGKAFSRGALYKMLSNRVYIGQITHKDQFYPGEHEAIVDKGLWDDAQNLLINNAVERRSGSNARDPSLLTGLIFDETWNPLTPSHASKVGVRYRYYISGMSNDGTTLRLPAREIENLVIGRLTAFMNDPQSIFENLSECDRDVVERQNIISRTTEVSRELCDGSISEKKRIFEILIRSVRVQRDRIIITCKAAGLIELFKSDPLTPDKVTFEIDCPYTLKRRGNQAKLILDNERIPSIPEPDQALIRAVARAHVWNKMLINGGVKSISEIARNEKVTSRYIRKILPLAHLAPDIVSCICEGKQPRDLNLDSFVYASMPHRWPDQRQKFGFKDA